MNSHQRIPNGSYSSRMRSWRPVGQLAGFLSAALVATGLVLVVAPAPPAFAASIIADSTNYGPNSVITITGQTDYVTNCPAGGTNDVFGISTARVYIIPEAIAAGINDGSKLTDVQPYPHVVVDSPTAGFISEPAGFTQPAGHVGPGTYALVVDECQDGIFHAGIDDNFQDSFTVSFPTGTGSLPKIDPNIAKIKGDAGLEAARWAATLGSLKLIFWIESKLPQDQIDKLISKIEDKVSEATGVDPRKDIQTLVLNEALSYGSVFADPPDPNFTTVAPLQMSTPLLATQNDPLTLAATALGNQANVDSGTAQGALNAMQRYEGAQQAGDLQSGLNQALALQGYASDLAAQLPKTNAALTALSNQIGALPASFDTRSAQLALVQQQVKANGVNSDQMAELTALGIPQATVNQEITDFESEPAGSTRAQLQAMIGQLIATNTQAASDYQSLATDATNGLPPLITNLQTQETNADAAAANAESGSSSPTPLPVAQPGPTASPGGPYTGTVGAPIALDGSASMAASGATISGYAWDDDGTGLFTSAIGAKPSIMLTRPFDGFLGLRVTDSNGLSSIAYTRLTVTTSAAPPTITAFSPTTNPRLAPNGSQAFSVTATPANASYQWSVDGTVVPAATGPGFTYNAPAATGLHLVKVMVTGSDPAGGSDSTVWNVQVLALPGALDHLDLSPSATNGTTGTPQGYLAEGWATTAGGDLGDVTAATSFSIAPDGSCAGATCTPAAVGTHTVTGTDGAAKGTATLTVPSGTVGTTTALAPTPGSPSVFGQQVQFLATVTPSSGTVAPTGSVDFRDGTSLLGSVALSNGTATFATSTLSVSPPGHSITATYRGSTTFVGSASAALPYTVDRAATSLTAVPTTNPVTLGNSDAVTITATPVAPGAGTPTGTVTLSVDNTLLAPATLSGAPATAVVTVPAASLPAGTHTLVAAYTGTASFTGSTSPSVTVVVNSGPKITTQPSDQTVVTGQTATFSAAASGTPTPTVHWQVSTGGGPFSDIANATSPQLQLTAALVSHSGSQYRAVFMNTAGTATTNPATLTVNKGSTGTALTIAPSPGQPGQPFSVKATVTPVAPAAGTPAGSVTVADNHGQTCVITLTGGTGRCSLTETNAATYQTTGTYSGDANFSGSASPAVTEIVGVPTPGGVFLTGHDPDFHGFLGGNAIGAQHILQDAVKYVTSGKASPSILLVTDRVNPSGGYSDPVNGLTAAGFTFDLADNGASGLPVLDLHTVNFANYDVVVVASDFGGWLRQSELGILNARSADIINYINGGGGLVALAESGPPNGLTTSGQFGFLPFVVSSAANNQSESGFTVTAFGQSLGLVDGDINGNASHNVFSATGGLQVVDNDANGHILSMAERGAPISPTGVPSLSIGDLSQSEPLSGTITYSFPVTLSHASTSDVTADFATVDGTATVADGDYAAHTGTLRIPAGATSATITVTVNGDNTGNEGTETFAVQLSNPVGATITKGTGTGSVVDPLQATPTISTMPSGPVTVGGNVSDSATLSNGASPTGTITFSLFGPGDSACRNAIATKMAMVAGNGTYTSGNVVAATVGTYNWVASYSGDAANLTATSGCGAETVLVTTAPTSISYTGPTSGDHSDTVTLAATLTTGVAPVQVFTGYADIRDANFPNPWVGAPGVVCVCSVPVAAAGDPDESAIRIDNPTNATINISDVKVTCGGGNVIDLWGSPSVPVGGTLILTGTATSGFDGSDSCAQPDTVTVTVNGVATTFNDPAHAIPGGPTSADETIAWSPVGSLPGTGVVGVAGKTLMLTLGSHVCTTGPTDANGRGTCTVTITDAPTTLPAGGSFAGDSGLAAATAPPVSFTVTPEETVATYTGAATGDFNDGVTLTGTLTDGESPAVPIGGKTLVLSVGSQSCAAVTDPTGKATCSVTLNQSAGVLNAGAAFAADANDLAAASPAVAFTVAKEEDTLVYTGATSMADGASVTLAAVLKEDATAAIAGRTVSFTLGSGSSAQTCSGLTDVNGSAVCSLTANQPPGAGSVAAAFGGDDFYVPASVSKSTTVTNATRLTVGPATSGDFNDPVTVSATLVDGGGNALANATVVLVLNNAESCHATTDPMGRASCSLTPGEAAGGYPLIATFAGDASHSGSSSSARFTVTHEETTLVYTGPATIAQGSAITLSAALTTDGVALANRTVSFTVGSGSSAQTCSATTNSGGVARCGIAAVAQPPGAVTSCGAGGEDLSASTNCTAVAVTAGFPGDAFYASSSATPAVVMAAISCTATITGTISGTVMVTNGTSCLNGATVGGAVLVSRGAAVVMLNSNVRGAVVAGGATAVTVCNSSIGGAVTVRGSTGLVLIGGGADATMPCAGNTLLGGVVLGGSGGSANTGGVELSGNTIGGGVSGSVTVSGNTGPSGGFPTENNATEIEGNTINGSITCASNTPAPTNDGQPNQVSGTSSGQCSGI